MWKPWKINNNYEIPPKPESIEDQVSMMWDFMYNHLPSKLARQDRKIMWQDIKLNFILVLVGLILAFIAARLFS